MKSVIMASSHPPPSYEAKSLKKSRLASERKGTRREKESELTANPWTAPMMGFRKVEI